MKKIGTKKGFTLIELMISIVIFVIFLGLVSTSYVSIVRAQRDANQVRKIYSEIRTFTDLFAEEVRLGAIDYDCYAGQFESTTPCAEGVAGAMQQGRSSYLALVRKGGQQKIVFKYENNKIYVAKLKKIADAWSNPGYEELVSDNLDVTHLSFAIFPDVNPYLRENYFKTGKQFQPKVTVFMTVENALNPDSQFNFDYQTTISSRVYSRAI